MRLAECEAETICNLGKGSETSEIFILFFKKFWWTELIKDFGTLLVEKENFNLSDLLSQTEEKMKNEKEKYNVLEASHLVKVALNILKLTNKI